MSYTPSPPVQRIASSASGAGAVIAMYVPRISSERRNARHEPAHAFRPTIARPARTVPPGVRAVAVEALNRSTARVLEDPNAASLQRVAKAAREPRRMDGAAV